MAIDITTPGPDSQKLRRLQLTELELLRHLMRICSRHGLRYYMVGGTMLGAVRHQGFVPWDDDIDIAMPRPDYERLREIARTELPDGIEYASYDTSPEHRRPFARLYDRSVTVRIGSNSRKIVMNAWIDIFVLDGMPKGRLRQQAHFLHALFWRFWYHAALREFNLDRPGRPLYARLLIGLLRVTHLGSGLDPKKLIRRTERILTRYPFDASDTVVSFYGAYLRREIVPRAWFGNGTPYPFEGITPLGPDLADPFLRHFYGTYMQLPDPDSRDTHHIIDITFSRS